MSPTIVVTCSRNRNCTCHVYLHLVMLEHVSLVSRSIAV